MYLRRIFLIFLTVMAVNYIYAWIRLFWTAPSNRTHPDQYKTDLQLPTQDQKLVPFGNRSALRWLPELPRVDPFSPIFKKYLEPPTDTKELKCNGKETRVEPWVKVVNGNQLVISPPDHLRGQAITCSILEIKTWAAPDCGPDAFWPPMLLTDTPSANGDGKNGAYYQLEHSDFALVNCFLRTLTNHNNNSMQYHFPFSGNWDGLVSGIHLPKKFKDKKKTKNANQKQKAAREQSLNLLVMVFDSVSRFTAEHLMPKTLSYLRNELSAAIFEHHTIVGENSYPNGVAMLTGLIKDDLPWPYNGSLVDFPLIWRNFSENGYATAYIEDQELTFEGPNARFVLVSKANLDTVWPPAWINHLGPITGYSFYKRDTYMCTAGQPSHEFLLPLPEAMWSVYPKSQPKFFWSWFTDYTHDYSWGAKFLDEPLQDMLQRMHTRGFLEDTVTIIMGDHGARLMEEYRSTPEGRYDHRTPFLAIVPPLGPEHQRSELKTWWENLRNNTYKLTSHFDIHATLWDILHASNDSTFIPAYPNYGQSLFTQIDSGRTCEDAGITNFYCPYLDWTADQLDPATSDYLGQKFASFVNSYQREYFKLHGVSQNAAPCEEVVLVEARLGGVLVPGEFYLNVFLRAGQEKVMEFQLSGKYEGYFTKIKFSTDEISRIDRIGRPPSCLDIYPNNSFNKVMKCLCWCKKVIKPIHS